MGGTIRCPCSTKGPLLLKNVHNSYSLENVITLINLGVFVCVLSVWLHTAQGDSLMVILYFWFNCEIQVYF